MNLRISEFDPESPATIASPERNDRFVVTVIGAGYVGLVSAACLAKLGFSVRCLDINAARVDALRSGRIPIYEPGLDALVTDQVGAGRLSFAILGTASAVAAGVVFLAVGTPSRSGGDDVDLTQIFEAARMLAPNLPPDAVVVTKSTVPVGTNRAISAIIKQARPDLAFCVVSNPEFLREGRAIEDFVRPARIVVGHDGGPGRAAMERIYGSFARAGVPILHTSIENAEMIKYAANAFLAMKIAFANEIADLCEAVGGDIGDVVEGLGLDPRIGGQFLASGPGFGGSCFPKDTRAFASLGRRFERPQRLIETVVAVNEERKQGLARRVVEAVGPVAGKTIAILGVAFKPDTDDVREAPSLDLIPALAQAGASVRFYDPQVGGGAAAELACAECAPSLADVLDGADAAVLLTEWQEFRELDLSLARDRMRGRIFIDFRNVHAPEAMRMAGFEYRSIGRGSGLSTRPASQEAPGSSVPELIGGTSASG